MYDSRTGGFITSVTTSDTDQNTDFEDEDEDAGDDCEVERGDAEKLILSQDTYNTLSKVGKKTVSFVNSKEDIMREDILHSCK